MIIVGTGCTNLQTGVYMLSIDEMAKAIRKHLTSENLKSSTICKNVTDSPRHLKKTESVSKLDISPNDKTNKLIELSKEHVI
jgi:hypothetical protein